MLDHSSSLPSSTTTTTTMAPTTAPSSTTITPSSSSSSITSIYKMSGIDLYFPIGRKPYNPQMAVMAKVIAALKSKENALLESPTGTGNNSYHLYLYNKYNININI